LGMRAHFRLAPEQDYLPWVDVFLGPGHELYVTPLPDGELLVAALTDGRQFDGPVGRSFERWISAKPELSRRLEGAEQITPLLGTSPVTECAQTGVAPGFALLGDAAGSLDPTTGGGMAQALMYWLQVLPFLQISALATKPMFFVIRARFAIFCSGRCGSAVAIRGSHPQKRVATSSTSSPTRAPAAGCRRRCR
jgi:hypothetical protein